MLFTAAFTCARERRPRLYLAGATHASGRDSRDFFWRVKSRRKTSQVSTARVRRDEAQRATDVDAVVFRRSDDGPGSIMGTPQLTAELPLTRY